MKRNVAAAIITFCILAGATLGAVVGMRAALGEPLLPWQGESVSKDTGVVDKGFKAPGGPLGHEPDTDTGVDYPLGDSFGFFAPHEEDDPGFNCLMHGSMSC